MTDDRSALYGDALFETVRVEEGGAVALSRHIDRFSRSARALGYPPICLFAGVEALSALATVDEPGIYRVTVGRDDPDAPFDGRGSVWTTVRPLPEHVARPRLTLLHDWYFPNDELAEHKSTSYLRRVEQRRRALASGFDDAISVSADGVLGEASTSNVFFDFPSGIVTPPARGLLPGVTRARILEVFDVMVRDVRVGELRDVRGIALTNAAQLAVAALDLDGRSLNHFLADDLRDALEATAQAARR